MKSVYTKEYEQLLTYLIDARKHAGISQSEVAARLGRLQTFVSKYERGERRLDVIEFVCVAHALGLSASDLVAVIEQDMPFARAEDAQ